MSFSRAKLQRFNDIKVCTPSKVKDIFKSVASQKDKLVITKSPSLTSLQSTPCFRTPNVPAKKAFSSKKNSKTVLFMKEHNEIDALKDKIVECKNKDEYIRDLMEQIEEMKIQTSRLEDQKHEMENAKVKFQEEFTAAHKKHTDHINEITSVYDDKNNKAATRIKELLCSINEYKILLSKLKLEYNQNTTQIQANLNELKITYEKSQEILVKEIALKEDTLKNLELELYDLKQSCENMQIVHKKELTTLNDNHKIEIQELEYEMLKTISELQNKLDKETASFDKKQTDLQRKHANDLKQMEEILITETSKMKNECEAKIKQMEENCSEVKILTEMQCSEKCKDIEETWKLKLVAYEKQSEAILKECQTISEYNIIQCELEKKKIKEELADKNKVIDNMKKQQVADDGDCSSCKHLNEKYYLLEMDLNNMISKLNEEQEVLEMQLSDCKIYLEAVLSEKKIYEITLKKTHNTVEALKKRLLESDRDVEQLKRELELCESDKIMYESKSNQLLEELNVVIKLYEDMDIQQEKYVTETKGHIADVEKQLYERVDGYKDDADECRKAFSKELQEKQEELDYLLKEKAELEEFCKELQEKLQQKEFDLCETLEQLHEQQRLTCDVQMSIGDAVVEIDNLEFDYNTNVVKLQNLIKKKNEEIDQLKLAIKKSDNPIKTDELGNLLKQITQLRDKSNSYYQYCEYYKKKAIEYEEEIEDLSKINKKYIDQSGKYDALLQKCEGLEARSSELEEKVREQEKLLQTMKNSGEVFDQILDYKQKNTLLIDDKSKMEKKIVAQSKLIEKLKKEVASLHQSPKKLKNKNEKENLNSPSRLLTNSHIGSPLKERN